MKMSTGKNDLGAAIKRFRLEAGLSQQEVAEKLSYKTGTAISLIESNARSVDANDLPKLALALGVTVSDLVGEESVATDFSYALRADKSLSKDDKAKILDYYNYVKNNKR